MKKTFTLLFLLLCLSFASACQKKETSQNDRPKILISIAPYHYFAKRLAGDTLDIVCLVPKGTNPHLYETPPRLIEEAMHARVWFRLGEPEEKKFIALFTARAPSMSIVNINEGLDLMGSTAHCSEDPCPLHKELEQQDLHTWLSPRLAQEQAVKICQALMRAFPQHATLYQNHLYDLLQDLKLLDEEIGSRLATHPVSAILISHPSLGYFCRDYGIEQLSVEIEGKEPLPNSLMTLLEEAKSKNIRKILLQPQHETRGAERIAKELEVPTQFIDPYAEDYLLSLRQIAQIISS